MNYYDELKSKNEILTVAFSLGYNGKKSGSSYHLAVANVQRKIFNVRCN